MARSRITLDTVIEVMDKVIKNGPSWRAKMNRDYDRAVRKERDV